MILRLRLGNARDGFLRDDENVSGSFRVDVVESQYEVILGSIDIILGEVDR